MRHAGRHRRHRGRQATRPRQRRRSARHGGNQDTEGPQAGQPYPRTINALRTCRIRQLEEKLRLVGLGSENSALSADLSDLLSKLTDRSSERSNTHKEGSFQLRGEEVARLAKFLVVDMPRISELLGKDITRISKLVDENMKMNTRVNLGDARSGGYQSMDERVSDGKRSGANNF